MLSDSLRSLCCAPQDGKAIIPDLKQLLTCCTSGTALWQLEWLVFCALWIMTLLKKPPFVVSPVEVKLMRKVVIEEWEVYVQAAVKQQSQEKACKIQWIVMSSHNINLARATSLAIICQIGCNSSSKSRRTTWKVRCIIRKLHLAWNCAKTSAHCSYMFVWHCRGSCCTNNLGQRIGM